MRRLDLLIIIALMVFSFGLAANLAPRLEATRATHGGSENLLGVLFGDGRKLFANHFFIKADVYFHSGFYPSIFDTQEKSGDHAAHMAADTGLTEAHEEEADFLGEPRDWIEAFGRNFVVSSHTHLGEKTEGEKDGHHHGHEPEPDHRHEHDETGKSRGREGEMLPWLRLSAELDPQRVETYVVGSFWLRTHLGRVDEAEQFLREGLRENPDSPEILLELGRIQAENRHNDPRARNLWELALARWQRAEPVKTDPNKFVAARLHALLSQLETRSGNLPGALAHLEALKLLSPQPAAVQKQIDELRQKLPAAPPR